MSVMKRKMHQRGTQCNYDCLMLVVAKGYLCLEDSQVETQRWVEGMHRFNERKHFCIKSPRPKIASDESQSEDADALDTVAFSQMAPPGWFGGLGEDDNVDVKLEDEPETADRQLGTQKCPPCKQVTPLLIYCQAKKKEFAMNLVACWPRFQMEMDGMLSLCLPKKSKVFPRTQVLTRIVIAKHRKYSKTQKSIHLFPKTANYAPIYPSSLAPHGEGQELNETEFN
ncbi:hypothetical protein C8J55DRAFT_489619 [Lentinula edodes]|uniref:PH domain-containing protein n=1 Tax=Lentinula lateritia TaxID=40482 RepID=A0A9W9DNU7_9AGAR|nr:hypothetical protein C8J55DRAFT_489619 [Lentinula edodes]